MKKGFYLFAKNKDYFFVTSQQNKTQKLAEKILQRLNIAPTESNLKIALFRLQKANCEIKTLNNGRQYYEIFGDNFGGCGSFVDDGNTIILNID